MRSVLTLLGALGMLGAVLECPVSAQDLVPVATPAPPEAVRAAGDWVSGYTGARPGQRWSVEALRFADGALRGRISVSGSPLIDGANVEGELSGRGVVGRLVDDEGKVLADFRGRVSKTGASGTYRDRTGEIGEWWWEGEIAR